MHPCRLRSPAMSFSSFAITAERNRNVSSFGDHIFQGIRVQFVNSGLRSTLSFFAARGCQ